MKVNVSISNSSGGKQKNIRENGFQTVYQKKKCCEVLYANYSSLVVDC